MSLIQIVAVLVVVVEVSVGWENGEGPSPPKGKEAKQYNWQPSRNYYSETPLTQGTPPNASNRFTPVVCPPNNPAWNKLIALQFIQDVTDRNTSNFDKYIATDIIQHIFNVPDGILALKASLSPGGDFLAVFGGQPFTATFEHVGAVLDYVWVHVRYVAASGSVVGVMELYRFECGFIKEHWIVGQIINATIPVYNTHPYF